MFGKRTLIPIVAATSIGLPYLASESGLKDRLGEMFASSTSEQPAAIESSAAVDVSAGGIVNSAHGALAPTTPSTAAPRSAGAGNRPLVGQHMALDALFRFDITSGWVLRNWPRVSTVTSEPLLRGYRVPVVSGVSREDIAGALTYYFDSEQKLQRIDFRGTTGEPRALVFLLQRKFQLRRVHTAEGGVEIYRANFNGRAISELRVLPATVVRSDSPHSRFRIEALIAHPRHVPVGEDGGRKMRAWRL